MLCISPPERHRISSGSYYPSNVRLETSRLGPMMTGLAGT